MSTIARMSVVLGMDSRDFEQGISKAKSSSDSFAKDLGKMGGAMTASITLPILGIAAASVKMANDFNASMANIASLGVPTKRVNEMKTAIQDLSIETGKSTDDLAAGMYQVVSAFGDGADSMKILKINAKAAKAGLATIPDTINMTSAVTKAWGDTSAAAVQHVADLGLKTVELGQTTLPELATSMQGVTLMTKNLGISQEEMFAVFAAGTGTIGSAADVATKFRGAEQALMAPNAALLKAFKAMGYESSTAMIKSEGLGGTFVRLKKYSESAHVPLTDMITSVEGLQFAMFMGGEGAKLYADKFAGMSDVVGKTDEAFLAQVGGINKVGFSMEVAQRYAEVLGQKLGDGLAPALGIILDKIMPLADNLIILVDQFAKMDSETQGWILAGIGLVAALGPLLMILPGIASAVSMVSGAMAVLIGPVGLVVAAVALLGAAWATNFGGIQEKTAAMWAVVQPILLSMGQWLLENAAKVVTITIKYVVENPTKIGPALDKQTEAHQMQLNIALGFVDAVSKDIYAWWRESEQGRTKQINASLSVLGATGQSIAAWWESTFGTGTASQRPIMGQVQATKTGAEWWAEFKANANNFNVQMELLPLKFKPLNDAIANASQAASLWWLSWQSRISQLAAAWMPSLSFSAMWDGYSLNQLGADLQTMVSEPLTVFANWAGGEMTKLWGDLQTMVSEPLSVLAEWLGGTLQSLWDAAQAVFRTPITLNVTTDTHAQALQDYMRGTPGTPIPHTGSPFHAAGGLAQGWSVVGEKGPELAYFGGTGAQIFSNKNSQKIGAFAGGTGPVPPIGPQMAPDAYPITARPAGLFPPIGDFVMAGKTLAAASKKIEDASQNLSDSAQTMAASSDSLRSALQSVPGLFGTSQVTADQMKGAQMGVPQDFADNYLRRLTDEVVNGVDWEGVDIQDAAKRANIDPTLPAQAILEMFRQAWSDSSLFANPANLDLIDQNAVKAQIQKQQDQLAGQYNILQLFGITDEGLQGKIQGLGQSLATGFGKEITPETFAPVGKDMMAKIALGFGDVPTAQTASGNMISAVNSALNLADTQTSMQDAGKSAAEVYWRGWTDFFRTVSVPVPTAPTSSGATIPTTAAPKGAAGEPVSSTGGMGAAGVQVVNYRPINSPIDIQALAFAVAATMNRRA